MIRTLIVVNLGVGIPIQRECFFSEEHIPLLLFTLPVLELASDLYKSVMLCDLHLCPVLSLPDICIHTDSMLCSSILRQTAQQVWVLSLFTDGCPSCYTCQKDTK